MIRALIFSLFFTVTHGAFAAKKISLALSATPSQLNPFFATDASSQNINRLVHLSLTDFEANMSFGCRLCLNFEERFEGTKHIIRFHLNPEAKFWDGSSVSAEDVRKSWKYFTDEQEIKSNHRFAFSNIEEVKVIDNSTVEIIYKEFSLENLSNLSLLKVLKLKSEENLNELKVEDIIGAGEYFPAQSTSFEIVLEPVDKRRPVLEFKVVRDETTLALKLINGEIDLALSSISPRKVDWLRKRGKDLKFWETQGATYIYVGLNHRSAHISDLNVRKALSHFLPREKVMEHKLRNTAVLATGLFSGSFEQMYLMEKPDSYDPELASQLLLESGYKKNKEGFWAKEGKIIELDWKVSNNKAVIEVVEVFKSYLEKNGISVKTTIQEWGTFMRSVKNGSFDVVMSQWVGFTGPDMLNFVFHSQSVPPNGANRGYFINPELDDVLDKAKNQTVEKVRTELYRKASQIANENYAYINLWHPNIIWIGKKCIKLDEIHSNGSYSPLLKIESHCEE